MRLSQQRPQPLGKPGRIVTPRRSKALKARIAEQGSFSTIYMGDQVFRSLTCLTEPMMRMEIVPAGNIAQSFDIPLVTNGDADLSELRQTEAHGAGWCSVLSSTREERACLAVEALASSSLL